MDSYDIDGGVHLWIHRFTNSRKFLQHEKYISTEIGIGNVYYYEAKDCVLFNAQRIIEVDDSQKIDMLECGIRCCINACPVHNVNIIVGLAVLIFFARNRGLYLVPECAREWVATFQSSPCLQQNVDPAVTALIAGLCKSGWKNNATLCDLDQNSWPCRGIEYCAWQLLNFSKFRTHSWPTEQLINALVRSGCAMWPLPPSLRRWTGSAYSPLGGYWKSMDALLQKGLLGVEKFPKKMQNFVTTNELHNTVVTLLGRWDWALARLLIETCSKRCERYDVNVVTCLALLIVIAKGDIHFHGAIFLQGLCALFQTNVPLQDVKNGIEHTIAWVGHALGARGPGATIADLFPNIWPMPNVVTTVAKKVLACDKT
ncbi:MAG: hypothetical protein LBP65_02780 [Puniceicoccales bacterium]|jgi:hypothetical protein|nr:hypothetical protein [Puniceicoccales bacterium]